jgi:hypothetical protein
MQIAPVDAQNHGVVDRQREGQWLSRNYGKMPVNLVML